MGDLLHHSLDDAARRHTSRDAFRFGGRAICYGELNERSNQLANVLAERGVERGDRVGIFMTKGLELPVALYGTLKAGAAYVPIDPLAPHARVRFLIEDCGIRHLITNEARVTQSLKAATDIDQLGCVIGADAEALPSSSAHCMPWEQVATESSHDPAVAVASDDLAYIMYTSGSTGEPKGLMHSHGSGHAYATLSAREYGVQGDDRLGNHSPLHFDMSTFEYLTGPLCGATTVIIRRRRRCSRAASPS